MIVVVVECVYVGEGRVKPLKYDPFYNSEKTSFRTTVKILTKFGIQIYIFEPKNQDLRSRFIILVNITHPYL